LEELIADVLAEYGLTLFIPFGHKNINRHKAEHVRGEKYENNL
jgi:hypothetical protein